jgi:ABC-type Fe3+ transport system substrate-binding protein
MSKSKDTQFPTKKSGGMTRRHLLAAASATAAFAVTRPAWSAAPEKTFEKVLEGAKKEGRVVVWAPDPASEGARKAAFDAFNKRFGLNIQGEWLAINPAEGDARVIAEAASGRASVDMIGSDSTEGFLTPVKAGVVKPYPYAEVFAKELPGIKEANELVIPELRGLALHEYDFVFGLAWNTGLVKEEDLPSKITDLTNPKFQGKFGLNQFALVPLDVVSYALGTNETIELAKKLLNNKPVLLRGSVVVANSVSTGTVPMGITGYHFVETARKRGEPVRFRNFSDIMPVSPQHVFVPENSPNPNTARLFAAWFATEGVKIVNAIDMMPNAFDPQSDLAKAIKAQEAKGAKIGKVQTVKMAEGGIAIRKTIQGLIAEQGTK